MAAQMLALDRAMLQFMILRAISRPRCPSHSGKPIHTSTSTSATNTCHTHLGITTKTQRQRQQPNTLSRPLGQPTIRFRISTRQHSSAATVASTSSSPFSNDPFGRHTHFNINSTSTSTSTSNIQEQQRPPVLPDSSNSPETASQCILSTRPVELSIEQQFLLDKVIQEKKSVFFTGSAGTGKSVLLRSLIALLKEKYTPGQVAVTASTGIAACNIGGCTLHRFAGIGLAQGPVDQLVQRIEANKACKARWKKTRVLIIDEISMVDGELFDKLEEIARKVRKKDKPFGGIQLIITGDFFQLPPVDNDSVPSYTNNQDQVARSSDSTFTKPSRRSVSDFRPSSTGGCSTTRFIAKSGDISSFEDELEQYYAAVGVEESDQLPPLELTNPSHLAKAPSLCFDSKSWKSCIQFTLQLTEIFRQRDPQFIQVLTEMRHGQLSRETCDLLKSLERTPEYPDDGIQATELFALREEVDKANHRYLRALKGPVYVYEPQDSGPWAQWMDKMTPAASKLKLKLNAQVMLIKNLSPTLVNGSMGTVVGFETDRILDGETGQWHESQFPVVRFAGEEDDLIIKPEEWRMEMPNGEVIGSRVQIPLILSWAMSIHKSQGQTMSRVKVDMGQVFEAGQAYVALSRATNLEGLQVLNFNKRAVQAHERVAAFYDGLMTVQDLMQQKTKKKPTTKRVSRAKVKAVEE